MLPTITLYNYTPRFGWAIQCKFPNGLRFREPGSRGKASAHHFAYAETEADARATMLIFLIEHELISLPISKPALNN